MSLVKRPALLLCLFLLSGGLSMASANPPGHALATAHPAATEAGLEILNAGGNAFDAAIAVSAVLGVVEPYSSGIGGGGFFLLHDSARNHTTMLDARERAPLAAHRDLYLDADGNVDRDRALNGPLAAGIPGTAAAWGHLAEHYAQLPLARSLESAVHHARDGVPLNPKLQQAIAARTETFLRYPGSSVFVLDSPNPPPDMRIIQNDLASTMILLAEKGAQAFYNGPLAETLVAEVRDAGGIWSLEDLEQYRVVEREPITIHWRDAEIVTAALPSATGVILTQVFNMLGEDWLDENRNDVRVHRLIEALRRAYLERAKHLGDPDHVDVPVEQLTSAEYARELMADFDPERATSSQSLYTAEPEAGNTTHFSILDRDGNWVSATLSINGLFGSGFTAPGTGVLLNNEMDDFSAKPGNPNLYGLIGSEANAIAPGKRMLSSMAPTAVHHANTLALLGTPGGSRITTMVMQGILQFLQGADAKSLVSSPRLHHQALPDKIFIEPDAVVDRERLEAKGHVFEVAEPWGNMQVVVWDTHEAWLDAASDPRGLGSAKIEMLNIND
ncbi:MAG: gamma-glutamyltransferase [Gammaproteobacteria bacterium]|nr:gamma-glutamyltransferase [Gammaproteobacteria bacterium]